MYFVCTIFVTLLPSESMLGAQKYQRWEDSHHGKYYKPSILADPLFLPFPHLFFRGDSCFHPTHLPHWVHSDFLTSAWLIPSPLFTVRGATIATTGQQQCNYTWVAKLLSPLCQVPMTLIEIMCQKVIRMLLKNHHWNPKACLLAEIL